MTEFKSITLELKAMDEGSDHGEFEAILSTADVDRDGETVAPGAFNPLPKSIPVHFSHDFVDKVPPVGRAVPFYDGDVLKCRGTFASTPRAQELRSLVNEGVIDSMSAGFLTTKKRGKSILTADLLEGSLTATPVNRNALLLRSKALEDLEEKAGRRNSSGDAGRLQQIHDLSVANGADCPNEGAESGMGYGKAISDTDEDVSSLAQAVDAAVDAVAGALENPDQVAALVTAAEAACDALLEALGLTDPDDTEAKAVFSTEDRKKLADAGAALPDGSYPIRNAADLRNAIQAIGRAKNRAEVMAHIKKRARALGLTDLLPDDWKSITEAKAVAATADAVAATADDSGFGAEARRFYELISEI